MVTLGVLSCLFGTMLALGQSKIKKLLIYSSIAQTGFLISAISINNLDSFSSAFIFLIIYLFTSIFLWNNIVLLYACDITTILSVQKLFDKSIFHFYHFVELFSRNSTAGFFLVLGIFSISGIPFFFGFFNKYSVLSSLIDWNEYFIAFLFIIISTVSVYYYIKTLKVSFFEPKILITTKEKQHSVSITNRPFVTVIYLLNGFLSQLFIFGLLFPEDIYLIAKFLVAESSW